MQLIHNQGLIHVPHTYEHVPTMQISHAHTHMHDLAVTMSPACPASLAALYQPESNHRDIKATHNPPLAPAASQHMPMLRLQVQVANVQEELAAASFGGFL